MEPGRFGQRNDARWRWILSKRGQRCKWNVAWCWILASLVPPTSRFSGQSGDVALYSVASSWWGSVARVFAIVADLCANIAEHGTCVAELTELLTNEPLVRPFADLATVFADEPELLAHKSKLFPNVTVVFADKPVILPDESKLLAHKPLLFTNVAKLLSDVTELLANITELLADQSQLLANVPQLLSHIAQLFSHVAKLLTYIPIVLADVTKLFANQSILFSNISFVFSFFPTIFSLIA